MTDAVAFGRATRIIWLGLTLAVVTYAIVAFAAVPIRRDIPFTSALNHPMFLGIHLVAVAIFGSAFVLPGALFRDATQTRARLIIRWALIESTAIFGLVCALAGRDARLFVPLGTLSIAGMLMSYPAD